MTPVEKRKLVNSVVSLPVNFVANSVVRFGRWAEKRQVERIGLVSLPVNFVAKSVAKSVLRFGMWAEKRQLGGMKWVGNFAVYCNLADSN